MFAQPIARPTWLPTVAPRRETKSLATARATSSGQLVDATVLYVAFPDAVRRWDAYELGTSALMEQARDDFAAAVAAHGGAAVPAHLDARSAVFLSAAAAVAAAIAVARAAAEPGAMPVAIGLASAPVAAGPFAAWELHARASAVAELAGKSGLLLTSATAERLPAAVVAGAELCELGVRKLPGLKMADRLTRVVLPGAEHPRGRLARRAVARLRGAGGR